MKDTTGNYQYDNQQFDRVQNGEHEVEPTLKKPGRAEERARHNRHPASVERPDKAADLLMQLEDYGNDFPSCRVPTLTFHSTLPRMEMSAEQVKPRLLFPHGVQNPTIGLPSKRDMIR